MDLLLQVSLEEKRNPAASGMSLPKDKRSLKKWLNKLADALKTLAGKAIEALSAIAGSVDSAILNFLGKVVGFAAEHT